MNANHSRAGWLSLVLVAGFVAGLGAPARAGVIVIDPAGANGAVKLWLALENAADGDIILLEAGSYTAPDNTRFQLSGKGLTLAADGGASVTLSGLDVHGVPAGKTVVLRGLQIGPLPGPETGYSWSLIVQQNNGAVWLEDCTVIGRNGTTFVEGIYGYSYPAPAAATIMASAAVTLQRCTLTGGRGADYLDVLGVEAWASGGGAALFAGYSNIDAHDTVFTGGAGGDGEFSAPFYVPNGGSGLEIGSFATVLLAGCTATGGSNGANEQTGDFTGTGLATGDNTVKVQLRDSTFTAGALVGEGIAWPDINAAAGSIVNFPAPARSFSVSSPLREGELGSLQVSGQPGDFVTLLVALGADWQSLPGKQGVLVENPASLLFMLWLGATDGAGQLSIPFVAPDLIPGVQGLTIPMQLVTVAGGATLEASSALVWLDGTL